jgi:NADH-quinone oxidoreductase subunit N
MNLLAASADLIMVFVAIEVLSLGLYVLSGFATRDLTSQESAFKYFLLGAFSSAILLYGIALTYGVTGSTNIAEAGRALTLTGGDALTLAAMGLLLARDVRSRQADPG